MTDETAKTNDPVRAPGATTPSGSPASSGTQPAKPAATEAVPQQIEYRDKPSDASKTQDKGSGTPAPRPSDQRSDDKKSNDPQRQPSPQNPKAPLPEGQARPGEDKNKPAKTPDAKPLVAPAVAPKAV
jgi:soluble lytic murein transglycosylase